MTNKAYMVYPGNDSFDEGCVLVFAENRNKARSFAVLYGPWIGNTYLEMSARRVKRFDKHAQIDFPLLHETNEHLPEPFFTSEEE